MLNDLALCFLGTLLLLFEWLVYWIANKGFYSFPGGRSVFTRQIIMTF